MSESPYIAVASEQDFQAKVIEASHQTLVLVDFWAPWCGPCRALTPTLEKLAVDYTGRFRLVKINVDENTQIAAQMQVYSLPTVKFISQGNLVDEFMGAVPESTVREMLERHLPLLSELKADDVLDLWQSGEYERATAEFQRLLTEDKKNAVALIGMGLEHFRRGELESAEEHLRRVNEVRLESLQNGRELMRLSTELRAKLYLAQGAQTPADSTPAPLAERFREACRNALSYVVDNVVVDNGIVDNVVVDNGVVESNALESNAIESGILESNALENKPANHRALENSLAEQALESFLHIIKTDRKFAQDGGRKAFLATLDLLPADSSLVRDYRAQLSNLIFR